ncbi:MAG TPA: response regulator [Pyrinomonadaceae bacterium]|jgi:CheY-like chemotaxis protein
MKKKVLIVEDVADVRAMMEILIEGCGCQAITAADRYDAVEKIRKHHPGLVLMAFMMPVPDGIGATRIIRNSEEKTKIPIIALTAYHGLHRQKALAAGRDAVTEKPLNPGRLQPLLDRYLD